MEEEFNVIFDLLDPTFRGYIDYDQIQEFHEAFYFAPISWDHIKAAVDQVCGTGAYGKCPRKYFLPFLFELERRKTVEENAWWDFKALDTRDCDKIPIKETLLLFKATHQQNFTMATWHKFMASRNFSLDVVCFDDIRMWLCNLPLPGAACDHQEVVAACDKLETEKKKADYKNYKQFIALQEDDFIQVMEAREWQQYRDKFQRGAKRKLNRWVSLGVEALIFDDGLDFDNVERMARNCVTVQDLLVALDEKYDILREKLLWEAVHTHIGEPIWSSMSESDKEQQVLHVRMKTQQLHEQSQLDQITQLSICSQQYDSNLMAMLGCTRFQHQANLDDIQNRASMLKADGKTDDEIFQVFTKEHAQKIEGTSTVGHLLLDLHKRQSTERQFLLAVLKGIEAKVLTSIEMITEYVLIASQQITATEEKLTFEYCAMATGLSERPQEYKSESFDSDRDFQELLALARLHLHKGNKLRKDDDMDSIPIRKTTGVVDWQVEVIRQVLKKHLFEREVLVYLLQGKESGSWQANARRKMPEKQEARLKELRSQCANWRESSVEYRSNKRNVFIRMLLEAVALYRENRRREIQGEPYLDDTQVSVCVLADIQQRQAQEVEAILLEMQYKTASDLSEIWQREHKARREEWLDNITMVCLAMYQLSKEEREIVQALEEKYECLRDKLLIEVLISECGKKEWLELHKEEHQRRLMQKKLEVRRCRQDGRLEQLSRILGKTCKDKDNLISLMGRSREEYAKYLEERLMQREVRRVQGLESGGDSHSEITEKKQSSGNILNDLQCRYDNELESILALLQKQNDSALSERERQELLLRLRLERRRAERENNFDEAALLIGLAERNRLNLEERPGADYEWQLRLARKRIVDRKSWKVWGEEELIEPEDQTFPEAGDLIGWKDSVLKELERKHASERKLQLTILMDEGSEDLREAAKQMTDEGRHQSLQDVKISAENLNVDKKDDQEANRDILEESGAIKSVLRRLTLKERNKGGEILDDEMVATLLADLQQEQDKETEVILMSLTNMNDEQLSHLRRQQIWERQKDKGKNMLLVFTMYEGVGSDEELLRALDKKYDTLREKLLLEYLKKQMGVAQWGLLSEQDRQRKLIHLRKEERKLCREGKLDELARLLGDHVKSDKQLKKLMGDTKAQYNEKLRSSLEARRTRQVTGIDLEDEGISEDEETSEDQNAYLELNKRFDEERDALRARLHNSENQYLSEKERQIELTYLKQEEYKARMGDEFMAAALAIGLAERRQTVASKRLKEDRIRQERLAKKRIEAMKNKEKQTTVTEKYGEVIDNGDRAAMQEAVIKTLERKHIHEREVLVDVLQHELTGDDKLLVDNLTLEQRQEILQELWGKRKVQQFKTQEAHMDILQEAASVKAPGRKERLEKESKQTVAQEEVMVSIMADLQQQQDKESKTIIQQLPEKDLTALVKLQQQNIMDKGFGTNENVAIVLTTADVSTKAGDEELVEALENTFDVLRDKVLTEALMKQMGEGDWAKLSEKQRQLKLMKLKLQERKLREEGKYNKIAELLGDAVSSQQALELLLGDTKKVQEERMRKMLDKRKARLAQGMTEEEAQNLEDEEVKQEEEELKKKTPKNILEDLDHRLDAEKEALLAGLRGQDDHIASEQARQAELARLRRQQRKARKEDKFDAAALAMGLVQDAQNSQDALRRDRKRQEQLAREHLMQRKKAMQAAKEAKQHGEPVTERSVVKSTGMTVIPMPENEKDKIAMQDVVVKELEMKHSEERELLIQLIEEETNSERRTQAKAMSEEKRQKRLAELKDARQQWRDGGKTMDNEEEQLDILHRGTAIQLESRIDDLQKTKADKEVNDEDAQVNLLADLQQYQDEEAARLMKDLDAKSVATLKQMKQVQFIARHHEWYDNVAHITLSTRVQGDEVTQQQLINALENKYDALRDKLLAESLINQVGAAEWAAMSEKERQARLMQLRLQERKLRQEGKFDEATALLTQGIKNQDELIKMLGNTKAQQEERMRKRLERLKQLKVERAAEGLTVDDDTLEELVDKEESRKDALEAKQSKKRNILEDLNNHFEDEKNALMAALRNQDAQLQGEKQRQMALAKLRREQRKLNDEDNFNTAAMIFGMAQENEAMRQTNLLKEKERQKQLARERLLAQRKKRSNNQEASQVDDEDDMHTDDFMSRHNILIKLKKEEEDNANADAIEATKAMQGGGQVALHDAVQDEIEKKHQFERDVTVSLMDVATMEKTKWQRLTQMSDEALAEELSRLKEDHTTWKTETDKEFGSITAEQLAPQQIDYHLTRIAYRDELQLMRLKEVILLRMEDIRRNLVAQGKLSEDQLEDEVCVCLLAELQSKQTAEYNALLSLLTPDQDNGFLVQLKLIQRRQRREYWLENVIFTVFNASAAAMEQQQQELSEEDQAKLKEQEDKIKKMEAEMQIEKQELLDRGTNKLEGSNFDAEAMLRKLEAQHETKKRAMQEQLTRQKRLAMQKLEARRQRRQDKDYEELAAVALLQNAEKNEEMKEESTQAQKEKQSNLMKMRLAARREARKKSEDAKIAEEKRIEEEACKKVEIKKRRNQRAVSFRENESLDNDGDVSIAASSASSRGRPAGFALKREKTVIDIDVSEEKKKELFERLMQDHSRAQMKLEADKEERQKMLKQRLMERKNRNQNAAAMILGLGERQKSIVERTKKEERERQIHPIKERIERVRYGKTQTMKLRENQKTQAFINMHSEKGLSKDEVMAQQAAKLQEKFNKEQLEYKSGTTTTFADEEPDAGGAQTFYPDFTPVKATKIDAAARKRMMKEKRLKKKELQKHSSSVAAASDIDALTQMINERKNASSDAVDETQ